MNDKVELKFCVNIFNAKKLNSDAGKNNKFSFNVEFIHDDDIYAMVGKVWKKNLSL